MKAAEDHKLSEEWLELVKEAMQSNKSKMEFKVFLEEKMNTAEKG